MDYLGNDISDGHYVSTSSAAGCQGECQRTAACNYWTWDPTYHTACWMKTAKTEVVANSDVTSGPKYCEGDHTTSDPSGDTDSMRVGRHSKQSNPDTLSPGDVVQPVRVERSGPEPLEG